jgi:AraC-like DNA-binding protein
MDDLRRHVLSLPRRWPTWAPLACCGHHPKKTWQVRGSFKTCNLSLILDGHGVYHYGGKAWTIRAPAAFLQWPDAPMDYAPRPSWRELYLDFPAACLPELRRRGWFDPARPCWNIGDGADLRAVAERVLALIRRLDEPGAIDLLDRAAEEALLIAHLHADRQDPPPAALLVRELRRRIAAAPAADHDPAALAQSLGLGRGAWRRWWQREVGTPPHRFLIEQRLRLATRMLAEDERPVGEIARACGFADPLYFARRFRAFAGCTASAYRARYRGLADIAGPAAAR